MAKNTIQNLTRELGEACLAFQDKMLRNLPTRRVECDEVWCYCYAKDANLPDEMRGMPGVGSMWTWTALDAESKLIISWQLGARDAANGYAFMQDVSSRLSNRIQMTTDGNRIYLDAIDQYFREIDYSMLIKVYGAPSEKPDTRYSPAKCLGTKKRAKRGNPDMDYCSTSYAERQNLNVRMQNRRFTRLTNAFSKKADMLAYSLAITFCYHNWVRKHQTLGATPAVAAGLADRPWRIEDLVDLMEAPIFRRKKVSSN